MMARLFPRRHAAASLAQLDREVWAIDASTLRSALGEIRARVDKATTAEIRESITAPGGEVYERDGSTAVIAVDGLIVGRGAQMLRHFGIAATGTDEIRAAIAAAIASKEIEAIRLEVDSPGGAITGLEAAAHEIANSPKPIAAHASGTAASAAYWLAASADSVTADIGTPIGSIGTFATVADSSRAAAEAGVSVHVLRSGVHKGLGTPGAPVTPDDLAHIQKQVDASAASFRAAVARGRDLAPDRVAELATGETWPASEALAHGLIDGIRASAEIPKQEQNNEEPETMENENQPAEMAALIARLTALEAKAVSSAEETGRLEKRAELAESKLGDAQKRQAEQMITAAIDAGRVTPAQRPQIEALAERDGYDLDRLSAVLDLMPAQTGHAPAGAAEQNDAGERWGADDEAARLFFGHSVEDFAKFGSVATVGADGTITNEDGSTFKIKKGGN